MVSTAQNVKPATGQARVVHPTKLPKRSIRWILPHVRAKSCEKGLVRAGAGSASVSATPKPHPNPHFYRGIRASAGNIGPRAAIVPLLMKIVQSAARFLTLAALAWLLVSVLAIGRDPLEQLLTAASAWASIIGAGAAAIIAIGFFGLVVWAVKPLCRSGADSDELDVGTSGGSRIVVSLMSACLLTTAAILVQLNAGSLRESLRQGAARLSGPPEVVLTEAYRDPPPAQSDDSSGQTTFDHSAFDALLKAHVDVDGWIDYAAFAREQAALNAYIASLGTADFDALDRDAKLAFLINAYNAFSIRLILDHNADGSLESINDIPAEERWDKVRWNVAGRTMSLNQIEHEEIRPNFKEPRIHFALVCAAVGCPPLRNSAFSGSALDGQLEQQTKYVHSHKTWLRFAAQTNTVHVTRLYDWYGSDFEQTAGSVLDFIGRYNANVARATAGREQPTLEFLDYDWSLNDISNREPR